MPLALLILAQAAQPAPAPQDSRTAPPPDIEIRAEIRAREVEIERADPVRVDLTAEPEERRAERAERSQPAGNRSYRNLTIRTYHAINVADPLARVIEPVIGGSTEPQDNRPDDDEPE